jgi:hypothetical protein
MTSERRGRGGQARGEVMGGGTPRSAQRSATDKMHALFGVTGAKKSPFRPSSPSSSRRGGAAQQKRGQRPLLDSINVTPGHNDEYLTTAIMLHLPIMYGAHYNRGAKAAVRRIDAPSGVAYVQPVHRNVSHSWTAVDVNEGDLYVLFVPFHKITTARFLDEIASVEQHLHDVKKKLVTTPQQQRSRRWFLHDCLNYVLPKTELMLRDFAGLVDKFGADSVVYQMGVIRLLDESDKGREDVLALAVEESDAAMPAALLRFSTGRLKEVLHSGNLAYAVRKLREHFYAADDGGASPGRGQYWEDPADGSPARRVPQQQHEQPPGELPSQLVDIDREIERLQQRAANDTWGNDEQAADEDDVEDAYAKGGPLMHTNASSTAEVAMLSADRYMHPDDAGSSAPAGNAFYDDVTGAKLQAPSPQQPARHSRRGSNVSHGSAMSMPLQAPPGAAADGAVPGDDALQGLPDHLRAQFAEEGAAEQPPQMAAMPHVDVPNMTDFDAMYAAVETNYTAQ